MTTPTTVVQFVCFDTKLGRESFINNWLSFANSFISVGLERIVLAERISEAGSKSSYAFISRNEWPQSAFLQAVRSGRVGDGGGGPVAALQGGVFSSENAFLSAARPDQDKLIGLLRTSNEDVAGLGRLITSAFAGLADVQVSVLPIDHSSQGQRYDVVAEIYSPKGQGLALKGRLEVAVAGAVDPRVSSIEVYREVLTLPSTSA